MYSTLNRKVKECFILADMGKDFTAISLRDHLTKFRERKREVETWTNTHIDRIIRKGQNPPRFSRFNKWNWELKAVSTPPHSQLFKKQLDESTRVNVGEMSFRAKNVCARIRRDLEHPQ